MEDRERPHVLNFFLAGSAAWSYRRLGEPTVAPRPHNNSAPHWPVQRAQASGVFDAHVVDSRGSTRTRLTIQLRQDTVKESENSV
jgi:hypothetical protein